MTEVDLDGAGVDMYVEPTEAAMTALEAVGADFRTEWGRHRTVMGGLEGRLGQGPLGREFAAQYNPVAAELATSAESLAGSVEQRARSGRSCALIYLTADDEGRRAFES
jgi:hypothetical protein